MYELHRGYYTWNQVIQSVLSLPKHTDVMVEAWMVPKIPNDFTKRMADNDKQLADYGLALKDGTGIHVKVYDGYYKVHWDEIDPKVDPIGHLIKDAPHWLVIVFVVLVGVAALAKSR
jgi:hypothetical protein